MKKVKLISGIYDKDFEDEINKNLSDGWDVIGQLSTCFEEDMNTLVYSILIQKEDEN